jgi:hypothetical protein
MKKEEGPKIQYGFYTGDPKVPYGRSATLGMSEEEKTVFRAQHIAKLEAHYALTKAMDAAAGVPWRYAPAVRRGSNWKHKVEPFVPPSPENF